MSGRTQEICAQGREGGNQSGDRVPYALLSMADAFYRLHACGDATTSLQALIRGFARSPVIGDARARLRDVQHAPAGYCQDAASASH
ncbi:MAG: hypothetical protein U0234_27835 [Sandaracinus sp.]